MKVAQLIVELQKHDPEKEVMIQQGEEFDYMEVYSVKEKEVIHDDDTRHVVVIEYM